jgi:predicted RNA binding protein YcfA (HicA-like mRNA interferase family)
MPRKIRELKAMLRKAGFVQRAGKGSHTVWSHPLLIEEVVLSGGDGEDAKRYQERDVLLALRKVEEQDEP